MKNKSLIILGLLVIGVYAYFDKKKKDQTKPYTDAELNTLITDFVNKARDYAISKGKTQSLKDNQQAIDETKFIFSDAKAKGKDLSKTNVDKFFKVYWIVVLNQMGDTSQGVATKEDNDFLIDFLNNPLAGVIANQPFQSVVLQPTYSTATPPAIPIIPQSNLPVSSIAKKIVNSSYTNLPDGVLEPKVIQLIAKK